MIGKYIVNYCGGQLDVENGVQWVQPLLLATAKPVALQHHLDHHTISKIP
ncbi:hypothetical protein QUF63_06530 [Anaerolineales bacterium HSG25]|nr:hypothetical protein [Anaerolineales bacterium HSG25]